MPRRSRGFPSLAQLLQDLLQTLLLRCRAFFPGRRCARQALAPYGPIAKMPSAPPAHEAGGASGMLLALLEVTGVPQ